MFTAFLAEAKPGEKRDSSVYEQMKDLGAITSNAIRLLGNASALLSKERRKAVLNKNQFKGKLYHLLPPKSFRKLAKVCLERDLKHGSRPDQRQQRPYFQLLLWGKIHDLLSFFRGRTTPSGDEGTAGVISASFCHAVTFTKEIKFKLKR